MTDGGPAAGHRTHEVTNQPPPLAGHDAFALDAGLGEAVGREGAAWAGGLLGDLGRRAGSEEAVAWGFAANRHPPTLHTHDRFGHRIDEVEFHPAWHALMEVAVGAGLHAAPWREPVPGAHAARAAAAYLWYQVEQGHACPVAMTYAVVPALRASPAVAAEWEPRFLSLDYDPGLRPAAGKRGSLCGMAMTEKQGGSDVRANRTRAVPGGDGGHLLTGHKWFCSAPMCDAFLVLAQAPGGLSCFLLPRVLPDGTRNRIRIQRLKDKLGNRSNASSEIELDEAWAAMVGPEGRGVPTIIEMVNLTRLDCVVGSAATMRQALVQAAWHCRHRSAFGRRLVEQPAMTNVLADLAVESEAATALMVRLAGAVDRSAGDPAGHEARLRRIAVAVGKYWVCKRTAPVVAEALECLGGNGYVEDSGLPRLYREAPLNSIWEGSGNVIALDVLRAMHRDPGTVEAVLDEVALAAGADRRLDDAATRLAGALAAARGDPAAAEGQARRLVERLAVVLQGALVVRHAPAAVADAFCATRLAGEGGVAFGTLPPGTDTAAIVERAAAFA